MSKECRMTCHSKLALFEKRFEFASEIESLGNRGSKNRLTTETWGNVWNRIPEECENRMYTLAVNRNTW